MADVVDPQVGDAVARTNVKSWHDVHMGIAAGMAESHATTIAALNQTFVANIASLQKRVVEPDIEQSIAARLFGGAGQAAVQSDQVSALANNLAQLAASIAEIKQVLGAVAAAQKP